MHNTNYYFLIKYRICLTHQPIQSVYTWFAIIPTTHISNSSQIMEYWTFKHA